MDLGSILLILALAAMVVAYVARPLLEDHSQGVSEREHTLSALMAERERLLEALLELDFDHTLGKIPVDVYPEQRQNLVERSARVLHQLDELLPETSPLTSESDDPLEALIAQRRAKRGAAPESAKSAAGFCHACGKPLQPGDQFCAACGASVS